MDQDRRIAPSPFPGDDGEASPATRDALAVAADRPETASYLRAVAALCGDRVLVPVVATATRLGGLHADGGGPVVEKEAEMAVVLLRRADGGRAVLAFTGLDSLARWRPEARPVPVTLDVAAQAARAERAGAILVDPAGPAPLVIEADLLDRLAAGHRLVETGDGGFGWAMAVQA